MVKTRSHVNGGNCRKCCFSLFLAMGAVLALNLLQLRIFQEIKCSMFMDIFSSVVSWRRGVIDQRKGGGDRRMSRLLGEMTLASDSWSCCGRCPLSVGTCTTWMLGGGVRSWKAFLFWGQLWCLLTITGSWEELSLWMILVLTGGVGEF